MSLAASYSKDLANGHVIQQPSQQQQQQEQPGYEAFCIHIMRGSRLRNLDYDDGDDDDVPISGFISLVSRRLRRRRR